MKKLFFMRYQRIWYSISIFVIAVGASVIVNNAVHQRPWFNLGIDFTGGTSILLNVHAAEQQVKDTGSLSADLRNSIQKKIAKVLKSEEIDHYQLTTVDKYYFLTKTSLLSQESVPQIVNKIKDEVGELTVLETDYIGPTIGYELKRQSVVIILIAGFLLLIYITFRFELLAAVAAIIALAHDAFVVLGLTALLQLEVNTAFVAAILTILGYSINDTIVIFDRIRENSRHSKEEYPILVEQSIRQTITRSINTSMTTLVVLLAIYIFGGGTLKDFALVLFIGIISGTYSSIFIASPVLAGFKKFLD